MANYYLLNAHVGVPSPTLYFLLSAFELQPEALKSTLLPPSPAPHLTLISGNFSDNKLVPERIGENHKFSLSVT